MYCLGASLLWVLCLSRLTMQQMCEPLQFQCDVVRCVPLSARCNGISECVDASDEQECEAHDRRLFMFSPKDPVQCLQFERPDLRFEKLSSSSVTGGLYGVNFSKEWLFQKSSVWMDSSAVALFMRANVFSANDFPVIPTDGREDSVMRNLTLPPSQWRMTLSVQTAGAAIILLCGFTNGTSPFCYSIDISTKSNSTLTATLNTCNDSSSLRTCNKVDTIKEFPASLREGFTLVISWKENTYQLRVYSLFIAKNNQLLSHAGTANITLSWMRLSSVERSAQWRLLDHEVLTLRPAAPTLSSWIRLRQNRLNQTQGQVCFTFSYIVFSGYSIHLSVVNLQRPPHHVHIGSIHENGDGEWRQATVILSAALLENRLPPHPALQLHVERTSSPPEDGKSVILTKFQQCELKKCPSTMTSRGCVYQCDPCVIDRNSSDPVCRQETQNCSLGCLGRFAAPACKSGVMDATSDKLLPQFCITEDYYWGSIIFCFPVLLVTIILAVLLRVSRGREKRLREELILVFAGGARTVSVPRPDHPVTVPNMNVLEIPRDRLKLGEQFGRGQLGLMLKGKVWLPGEVAPREVLVKTVVPHARKTHTRTLASELQVWSTLLPHINVLRLLGACTSSLDKDDLLVVVEFCHHGNLHDYLSRNRSVFIDQVDRLTDRIDPRIGADIIASFRERKKLKRSQNVCTNNPGPDHCYKETAEQLASRSATDSWVGTQDRDRDRETRDPPVCTGDLLSWVFQVARGMEYLADRKIVLGNLAARHVLLSDDNIVKISDFSLSRSVGEASSLPTAATEFLPLKWMAVESLKDRTVSLESDVWSYGIFMWEVFSLAQTPYPDIESHDKLHEMLVQGHRMDKPQFGIQAIHDVMMLCWRPKPEDRPSFHQLVTIVGGVLEDNIQDLYLNLTHLYDVITNLYDSVSHHYYEVGHPETSLTDDEKFGRGSNLYWEVDSGAVYMNVHYNSVTGNNPARQTRH